MSYIDFKTDIQETNPPLALPIKFPKLIRWQTNEHQKGHLLSSTCKSTLLHPTPCISFSHPSFGCLVLVLKGSKVTIQSLGGVYTLIPYHSDSFIRWSLQFVYPMVISVRRYSLCYSSLLLWDPTAVFTVTLLLS